MVISKAALYKGAAFVFTGMRLIVERAFKFISRGSAFIQGEATMVTRTHLTVARALKIIPRGLAFI